MSAPDGIDEAYAEFGDAVTMSPKQLEEWLETDESQSVGQKDDSGGESTGHASGRRIVEILRKKKAELTDEEKDAISHRGRAVRAFAEWFAGGAGPAERQPA